MNNSSCTHHHHIKRHTNDYVPLLYHTAFDRFEYIDLLAWSNTSDVTIDCGGQGGFSVHGNASSRFCMLGRVAVKSSNLTILTAFIKFENCSVGINATQKEQNNGRIINLLSLAFLFLILFLFLFPLFLFLILARCFNYQLSIHELWSWNHCQVAVA